MRGSFSPQEIAICPEPLQQGANEGPAQSRVSDNTGRVPGQLYPWAPRPGPWGHLQIQMGKLQRLEAGPSLTGAHGPLRTHLLELLGFLLQAAPVMCPLVFQGRKGKQGKAGAPGRRGIQVSGLPLLLFSPTLPSPEVLTSFSCTP